MKQLLIPSNEQCPYYNKLNHFCHYPDRSYKSWCNPQGNMNFPNFCPLEDALECIKCKDCERTKDHEPTLTIDEEIDQLFLGIEALSKHFWTPYNLDKCNEAKALLCEIDLDMEVDPE